MKAIPILIAIIWIASVAGYHNEESGFSIEPPMGWEIVDYGEIGGMKMVVMLAPAEPDEETGLNATVNIMVMVHPCVPPTPNRTLEDESTELKEQYLRSITDFQVVSEGPRWAGNLQAYELVFTKTEGLFHLKINQAFLLAPVNETCDKLVFLQLAAPRSSYDRNLPLYEASIATFSLDRLVPVPEMRAVTALLSLLAVGMLGKRRKVGR